MEPVIRGISLKYGRHDLGEPFTNFGCRLGFTIIDGSSEIKAFRNKWFMLKETIKMVSILETFLSTKKKM